MIPCWSSCVINDVVTIKCFECVVQGLLNIAIRLVGVALFIMLIIGGFKFVTSGGDPKKVQSAKDTLTSAITGLILVILAWFFLRVIHLVTGVDITEFKITP